MKDLIIVVFSLGLFRLMELAYVYFEIIMKDDIELYHARTQHKIKKL